MSETEGTRTVSPELCDPITKPISAALCFKPCPNDCIIGNWGPWSPCSKECKETDTRTRTRHVLRHDTENGAECPTLTETDFCAANKTCFQYKWKYSNWSTCLLYGSAACGPGRKIRHVDCIRSDGRIVVDQMCLDVNMLLPFSFITNIPTSPKKQKM